MLVSLESTGAARLLDLLKMSSCTDHQHQPSRLAWDLDSDSSGWQ